MSIYEYDEKKHLKMERDEAREEGRQQGREEEKANTERERKRADKAEAQVIALREELERLRK